MKHHIRVQQIIHVLIVAGVFMVASVFSPHANSESSGNASDLFRQLDRNGDGGLSLYEIPQQMMRLRDAFDIVDANGDGIISIDEFNDIRARRQSSHANTTTRQPQSQSNEPVAAQTVIDGKGADAIHSRMQRAINNKELPGAVVMFIHNGKVVFEEAYGYADIESGRKQRIDDLFNLGSTSKPLAMTTVMTQVANGNIALDDPISKWIPEYAYKRLVDGTQAKRSPTVREMMSHTSGTFSIKCGKRRDLSLLYMFGHTLKESAEAIAKIPLAYQPGEVFCYGGPAMQVLGRTIEIITNKGFDDVARSEVFAPLGMYDTFYRTSKDLSGRIAVIYDKSGGDLKRSIRTRNPRGDPFVLTPGGVFSTAKDLSRFVQAHLAGGVLDGQRILPEELLLEMRRNQIGDNETDFGDPSVGDRNSAALGKIEGYGLGWMLDEINPDGSARVFSHGGAWGTYIWGDADAQLGAILLTQTPLTYATPVWNDVLSIARETWTENDQPVQGPNKWKPDVRPMGKSGLQYIDPEILSAEGLMTYQDQSGDLWVARLDTESGLFASDDGKDFLMSKDALGVRQTYNGPEFGLDRNGWAVFFTKAINNVPQIWRSQLVNDQPQAQPLHNDSQRRQTILASKNTKAASIRLLYIQGNLGDGRFFWSDEDKPATENTVVRLKDVDSPRWIDNTLQFVFVESDGKYTGQIKLADTVTNSVRIITNDAGIKSFAYGWKAPEFGDDLLVIALVDYKSVGVWRDSGQKYFQRIATLTPPKASRYQYFGSPEPFVSQARSYVSLVLKDRNTRGRFTDSEVWVLGIDDDPQKRFARRVDDRRSPVMRSDPEVFLGKNEIYVYYNAVDTDRLYGVHRASTGLSTEKPTQANLSSSHGGPVSKLKKSGLEFDCQDSTTCTPIIINRAPPALSSDGSPSPFRGTVDASIISDPESGTLYLTYTSVSTHESSAGNSTRMDIAAGIALATSKNSGVSWEYNSALKPSVNENDPVSGKPGYASQEVSSIANGGGYWYLAYLRFHDPVGGGNNRIPDSFHLEIARARSPDALASADVVRLAGSLAADVWSDYRLSRLHADLSGCSLWLDPELFFQNGHLFLMSVCIPYESGTRRSENSFYAVFELSNTKNSFGKPRYLGKLSDAKDAKLFGAKELSKGDLAVSRDGILLFLVAPVTKDARFEEYPGCYIFEVDSLDPPRLRRDLDGKPIVRAAVKSSASIPTSASCAYDPGSDTGIVLTHRELLPSQGKYKWALYATGVHP